MLHKQFKNWFLKQKNSLNFTFILTQIVGYARTGVNLKNDFHLFSC